MFVARWAGSIVTFPGINCQLANIHHPSTAASASVISPQRKVVEFSKALPRYPLRKRCVYSGDVNLCIHLSRCSVGCYGFSAQLYPNEALQGRRKVKMLCAYFRKINC